MACNAFGLKRVKGEDEASYFGDCFIVKTIDAELKAAIDAESEAEWEEAECEAEQESRQEEKEQQRRKLKLYKYCVYFVGVLTLFGFAAQSFDVGKMFREDALMTTIMLLVLLINAVVLMADLYRLLRKKPKTEDKPCEAVPEQAQEEEEKSDEEQSELMKRAYAQLEIPQNALKVEVLSATYTENGKLTSDSRLVGYLPLMLSCYDDADMLYFCFGYDVYGFAKAGFTGAHKVDGKMRLLFWGKEDDVNAEKYAEYGIKKNSIGNVVLPTHVILSWHGEQGEFEILLPPYDAPAVLERLSLTLS